MATTTLRLYFRNIMFFVHRDSGTDVWFLEGHNARVYTREQVVSIRQSVVKISSGDAPLPVGPNTVDMPRVISFNTLAPDGVLSKHIIDRQLSEDLIARVELPGGGTLKDLPSAHSHGVLLDWSTPTLPDGKPHVQRLTEVAIYELPGVSEPVHLLVGEDERKIELRPTGTGETRAAEAFFLAGEESKVRDVEAQEGDLVIAEFRALHKCFDPETQARMEKVIPTAPKPRGGFDLLSAEPFCPSAQIDARRTP